MRATLAFVALLLVGCGTSPPSPTAPSSSPESSSSAETKAAPPAAPPGAVDLYAVDWPNDRRADLEIAMKEHVAVLAHDGRSARVLADCAPPGPGYESARDALKEDVVRFESFEQVRSKLVFTSARLAGRLETEMSRGAVVELAVAIAGTMRAPRETVRRSELRGDCKSATHFVRRATVGAFAMTMGTRDKRRAAAEIFTATITATSTSTSLVQAKDGSIEDCRAGKSGGCRALLELALAPLTD